MIKMADLFNKSEFRLPFFLIGAGVALLTLSRCSPINPSISKTGIARSVEKPVVTTMETASTPPTPTPSLALKAKAKTEAMNVFFVTENEMDKLSNDLTSDPQIQLSAERVADLRTTGTFTVDFGKKAPEKAIIFVVVSSMDKQPLSIQLDANQVVAVNERDKSSVTFSVDLNEEKDERLKNAVNNVVSIEVYYGNTPEDLNLTDVPLAQ